MGAAGILCNGGTLDGKDSNGGTTKAQCVDGGGSYDPYTCGDAEDFLQNNLQAKALGNDVVNYLVEEWYQPKCCASNLPAPLADESALFLESDQCPAIFAQCKGASACYDHTLGVCGMDGVVSLPSCARAVPICNPCFPNS